MFQKLYNYIRGTSELGQGTRPLGLLRPQTPPVNSIYSRRRNVQNFMTSYSPGYVKLQQMVVPVSMLGSTGGLSVYDPMDLEQLVKIQKAQGA